MNTILEAITGTDRLTDQIIAADFLNVAKMGIKNYAAALAETSSPEIRNTLKVQLNDAINTHEKITNYMLDKGWYQVHDVNEQIKMDLQNAKKAMNLPE